MRASPARSASRSFSSSRKRPDAREGTSRPPLLTLRTGDARYCACRDAPRRWPMPGTIVVIGGSAGALQPLRRLVSGLPASLDATVFVVIHTSPETPGALPALLAKHASLPVAYARDAEAVQPGHVVVAPVDHHLLVGDGRVTVSRGPRENGFRPAIDPLFRTAAKSHGDRVVAILLSGNLDDGTRGLAST